MNEKFLYNNRVFKDRRKELRNNSTEAEKILWNYLKHSKLGGFKFIRQYSVGPYILDFFCPEVRLAIELDGAHHGQEENVLYDKDRSKYLKSVNIFIIRFWNNDIVKDVEGSLRQILRQINRLAEPPLKVRGGRG